VGLGSLPILDPPSHPPRDDVDEVLAALLDRL
jgi:hypothetical protein